MTSAVVSSVLAVRKTENPHLPWRQSAGSVVLVSCAQSDGFTLLSEVGR